MQFHIQMIYIYYTRAYHEAVASFWIPQTTYLNNQPHTFTRRFGLIKKTLENANTH